MSKILSTGAAFAIFMTLMLFWLLLRSCEERKENVTEVEEYRKEIREMQMTTLQYVKHIENERQFYVREDSLKSAQVDSIKIVNQILNNRLDGMHVKLSSVLASRKILLSKKDTAGALANCDTLAAQTVLYAAQVDTLRQNTRSLMDTFQARINIKDSIINKDGKTIAVLKSSYRELFAVATDNLKREARKDKKAKIVNNVVMPGLIGTIITFAGLLLLSK